MLPNLGPPEMLMIMIVAVLLFGKRLPEVGRSLGKGLIEFKKGLRGIDDDADIRTSETPSRAATSSRAAISSDDLYSSSVPKFEPPGAIPVDSSGVDADTPRD